jgi:hypothetical protein
MDESSCTIRCIDVVTLDPISAHAEFPVLVAALKHAAVPYKGCVQPQPHPDYIYVEASNPDGSITLSWKRKER